MPPLRIAGYAPAESTHGRALDRLADGIRSAGLQVHVTHNIMDEGRPATDLLRLVEAGELLCCYFSTSYLGDRVPELNVLERPYLFGSLEDAHAALDGELGRDLTLATERRTGFEVLGYWDNGFRHMTNRIRPIRTPADVAGMRVRLQPNALHEEMIRAWGGEPVAVELSEGVRLIQEGKVDAQENPLANTVAYGVDRVHRFVTMTGHLYGARGVYANRSALSALPEAPLIRSAASDAIAFQRSIASDYELELRHRLESAGVEFVDLTEAERAAFAEATKGIGE
ncbi:MAG: TRAP transporter substrate-binding protein [Acidimicrobiia bacterium]|nr:TRAP transporter substrate-binding protein [Acidimicrobiia bacterium]MDH4305971.1 TRAP transporter substrate-binding protein [Acidimicrobiia bacterium]MDH5294044.1 TRAP transporter substrate-binding protein [Acidimicrobiia bacterium]